MENENQKFGFMLIDKPVGPTSFNIIAKLRKITNLKKIGHAGTLDPFANGLLIVAIGRQATKEISKYVKLDKEYLATLVLGAVTDTYDNEGEIQKFNVNKADFTEEKISIVVKKFIGKQKQIPPMFSAKKVGGKKLYQLARQGKVVEREPSDINIFELEVVEYSWPKLKIRVKCSSGTYIRSLGHDIGQALGCGAYLDELRRTKIGEFDIKEAFKLENLTNDNWDKKLLKI